MILKGVLNKIKNFSEDKEKARFIVGLLDIHQKNRDIRCAMVEGGDILLRYTKNGRASEFLVLDDKIIWTLSDMDEKFWTITHRLEIPMDRKVKNAIRSKANNSRRLEI